MERIPLKRLNSLLAKFMIAGTVISASLIAAGLGWYLSAHAGQNPGDHLFTGEPKYLENPVLMFGRALDWHSIGERRSLSMIGIFLLLLNPPIRVLLAGTGYLLENNRRYALISALVFLVLAVSFFW